MDTLKPVPPTDLVLAWARDLYAHAVDRKDAAGFAAAFTDNASLCFGNAAPIIGRSAIEEAIAQFFTSFSTLRHRNEGAWLAGRETLILEARVTYSRHDSGEVTIPAVTIFRLAGAEPDRPECPVADQCRIYVDLTPLYAPAA